MRHTKKFYTAVLSVVLFSVFIFAKTYAANEKSQRELIQIAILLDTSSSMDGLINQAKSQLWKVVNELATAKKNGTSPNLEVALYEYGNDGIPSGEGYIRMLLPLTGDLDGVSEKLFALTTNGGDEYCGMVIDRAVKSLKWSPGNDVLKVIFIAGNEPFTQGNVDYVKSCRNAILHGIIVNTIFCGNMQEGINTKWKDGADLADGKYMNIDQNQTIAYIEAPQDKEITRLGSELNNTYIAYGFAGKNKKEQQAKQDMNAGSVSSEAVVQRAVAKSAPQYNNASWDLIDAARDEKVDIAKLDKNNLPEEMKNMSPKERKEYVDKISQKRADIQKRLQKLNGERQKYVENEMKKQSKNNTLDSAMINAVHEQAVKKDYRFK